MELSCTLMWFQALSDYYVLVVTHLDCINSTVSGINRGPKGNRMLVVYSYAACKLLEIEAEDCSLLVVLGGSDLVFECYTFYPRVSLSPLIDVWLAHYAADILRKHMLYTI